MLANDLRLAGRLLFKSPLFTTIVVVTLALGIGLNTAVFSAVDALLLRPLPGVRAPEEIVQLYRSHPGDVAYGSNSIPHYNDLRNRTADVYSGVALWSFNSINLASGGNPQRVMGMLVSANFFSVLGVTPAKGRLLGQHQRRHRATVESVGEGKRRTRSVQARKAFAKVRDAGAALAVGC